MKWLLYLIILLVPQLVFAQESPGFSFTPPPSDYSILFLSDIFGVVDGVLHGTGSLIVGTMFGIFNAALLTLGAFLVMYIVIIGTLKTAHEGKSLGQKWDSMWIPIRAVIGIVMLIPKATGYSIIQVFVMWIVVQGVGVADSVWAGALNYITRGGSLVQPSVPVVSSQANLPLIFITGNILKAETCMYVLRNSYLNVTQPDGSQPQVPDFTASLQVVGNHTGKNPPCYSKKEGCAIVDTQGVIDFPGKVSFAGADFQQKCGKITWPLLGDQNQVGNSSAAGNYDSRSLAVQQLVLNMQPIAYGLAQILLPVGNSNGGSSLNPAQLKGSYQGMIINSVSDYMSIMAPYFNQAGQQSAQKYQSVLTQAAESGWMMAGNFYYVLTDINNQKSTGTETFTGDKITAPTMKFTDSYEDSVFKHASPALTNNVPIGNVTGCPENKGLNAYVCEEYYTAQSIASQYIPGTNPVVPGPNAPAGQQPPWWANMQPGQYPFANTRPLLFDVSVPKITFTGDDSIVANAASEALSTVGLSAGADAIKAINAIVNALNYIPDQINAMIQTLNTLQSNTNTASPILLVAQMGNLMINTVEAIWIDGMEMVGGASAIAALVSYIVPAVGTIILAPVLWVIPLATGILFMLFATGAALAYYVPLIPFIVFFFAVIGWFIAVVESMVAAPFVALGLASPEGQHEIFGPAYQAFMLLLNLFVRPTFIIFGFIFASILASVMLWVLNQSLMIALDFGGVPVSTRMTSVLSVVALIFIYMVLVLQVMNRCFALIHEIPARILRWIGHGVDQFGEADYSQAMQAAKGAVESLGSEAGKMSEGISKGVAKTGGGVQEAVAEYKKEKTRKAEEAEEEAKSKPIAKGKGSAK